MKQYGKNEEKKTIPWQLEKEIMRIRVEEDMTWDGACVRVAAMVNKTMFHKLVNAKAEELGKSRFFASLNTGRETIKREAEQRTRDAVRKYENNFHLTCPGCDKPLDFSDRDVNWYPDVYPVLKEAFARWRHTTCYNSN